MELDAMAEMADAAAAAATIVEMTAGGGDGASMGDEVPDAEIIELPVAEAPEAAGE
jgi:hypothetical protein